MLAKELLSRPDGFITVTKDGLEHIIDNFHRIVTHANYDDSVLHWTLEIKESGKGEIKR